MAKTASRKVIITCAITGSVHTPTMSPHLPITPDDIAAESVAAAEAGASIIHLHARDPKDGRPSPDPELFMQFLPRIKQQTDAILNITTGGGLGMPIEDRIAATRAVRPEMCTLNMGSMNFGIFGMVDKFDSWKHPWEKDFLDRSRDFIFPNTFKSLEFVMKEIGQDMGTRFECECYDVGHLYNLAYCLDQKWIEPPLFVQTIFGILGGIGPDPENLAHMKRIADKLFGDAYQWSILGAGRHQMPLITQGALMGGNVRVGLEDSLYLSRGTLAKSNAEQVTKIRGILEALGLDIARPDEVRELLKLKGADQVGF
jgi:uncharacterized protein (DUF849 family)